MTACGQLSLTTRDATELSRIFFDLVRNRFPDGNATLNLVSTLQVLVFPLAKSWFNGEDHVS